jgi:protein-L-isoaspartate(D-aspartate) O-methyltransferase
VPGRNQGELAVKPMTEAHLAVLRRHMVELVAVQADLAEDELGKPALDARVLAAMGRVPRHLFVPEPLAPLAYHDTPLPIGFGKTISQPFIVAVMTDLLDPRPGERVLEVGTGLGYQAALLAELAGEVCTVEVVEEFAAAAEARFLQLGYASVEVRVGDGSRGWAERAPFDRIVVTAAARALPPALLAQLGPGGRMVLPTGAGEAQRLTVLDKGADGAVETRELMDVRFTPLETA